MSITVYYGRSLPARVVAPTRCPKCGDSRLTWTAWLIESAERWSCSCGATGLRDGGAASVDVHVDTGTASREAAEQLGKQIRRHLERARARNGQELQEYGRPIPINKPVSPPTGRLVWSSDTGWVDKCDACTNDNSCKRLNQCLRYKCEFGKVDKP